MIVLNDTFQRSAPTVGGKVLNMSWFRLKLLFWGCRSAVYLIYEHEPCISGKRIIIWE